MACLAQAGSEAELHLEGPFREVVSILHKFRGTYALELFDTSHCSPIARGCNRRWDMSGCCDGFCNLHIG